jgi:hypothetical protein
MITIWATPMWIYSQMWLNLLLDDYHLSNTHVDLYSQMWLNLLIDDYHLSNTHVDLYSQMWLNLLIDDYHLSNTHDPQQDLTKIRLQAKYENKKIRIETALYKFLAIYVNNV